jgi:hypothetical protein
MLCTAIGARSYAFGRICLFKFMIPPTDGFSCLVCITFLLLLLEELHNLYYLPSIIRMIKLKEDEIGRACSMNGG